MAPALMIPVLLAGAVAAAVAVAPAAGAQPVGCAKGAACSKADDAPKPRAAQKPAGQPAANVPTGWLNESLWARPGPSGISPIGAGPKPPIMAMD